MIWIAVASGLASSFLLGILAGWRLHPCRALEVDAREYGLGERPAGHQVGVTVLRGRVVLNLGTSARFLAMDPLRALRIALALRGAALSLRDGVQKEKEPGGNPAPVSDLPTVS